MNFPCLFIVLILFICTIQHFFYSYSKKLSLQFTFKITLSNLYISVLIVRPHSKRINSLLKAWGNEFASQSGNVFKIFTSFNESINSKYINIVSNKSTRRFLFRLVFYLNFASARDFYDNTSLKWYLRTTYDCYIHLSNLYRYIQKLNGEYNPNKDIVMKGDHNKYFIHGGPGWIMSRAAVKEYLNFENEMTVSYLKNSQGDDVNIMLFARKYNLTYSDIYSPEFSGWPVKDESYGQLIRSNFSYSNITLPCRKDLSPKKVNSLVIWHNGCKHDYVNSIGKRIINEAPDFLGLHYFRHIGGEFCRLEEKSKPK